MKQNVGPREQVVRIAIGSAALGIAALVPRLGNWRWMLGLWGVANLVTGTARYCPTNALLGIDNTEGDELVHFDESLRDVRGRIGHQLNEAQHRMGAYFET